MDSMHDLSSFSLVQVWTIGAVCVVWWYCFRKTRYGSTFANIPGPRPHSLLRGNFDQFYRRHGSEFQEDIAFNYGSVVKFHGLLCRPKLYVSDPKALYTILVKEEDVYGHSRIFFESNMLVFGPGLLSTTGENHRKQRRILNPVFSTNNLRLILPTFYRVAHTAGLLRDAMIPLVQSDMREVDMLNWMSRTALELIGQGGLGYSFDPLVEETYNEYAAALKAFIPNIQKIAILRLTLPYVSRLGPAWFRRNMMAVFPIKQVRMVKSIVDSMHNKSTEVFLAKKAALEKEDKAIVQSVGDGRDIMSVLMKANLATSKKDKLEEEELIAQMSSLVFAATDTTSSTLARILQLLAEHPNIQEKLRKEIRDANAGVNLAYEDLNRLPLLDAVCRETLRLCPPLTHLARMPDRDVTLPLSEAIKGVDGQMINEIPIPKGTEIVIGILGSNASKARWGSDAHEWKPERWLSPIPKTVTDSGIPGIYSNLMTFMAGKRACIGLKFAEIGMKVVLAVLLSTFSFESTAGIEWNVAGIRYPTVGKESNVPQMPLKVKLLKS